MKARLWVPVIAGALILYGSAASAQDVKSQCQEQYKNCVKTGDLVHKNFDAAGKIQQTDYIRLQLADAGDWMRKADTLLVHQRARMDRNEYNDDVLLQLGFVWRWYVEAATAITRAVNSVKPESAR